jgi:hypothetical protein
VAQSGSHSLPRSVGGLVIYRDGVVSSVTALKAKSEARGTIGRADLRDGKGGRLNHSSDSDSIVEVWISFHFREHGGGPQSKI